MPDDPNTPNPGASPFTDAQQESLRTTISSIVNSAIAARDKMADKKRAEDRTAIQTDFAKLLDEKLGALAPKPKGDEQTDDKNDKGNKNRARIEDSVEFKTMQARFSEMQQRLDEAERISKAERLAGLDIKLRQLLSDKLTSILGFTDAEKSRITASYLIDAKKAVRFDEETMHPLFDDGLNPIDLDTGLRQWAKTAEAKHFLPPTNTRGSGGRPGANGLYPQNIDKDQALNNVFEEALKVL